MAGIAAPADDSERRRLLTEIVHLFARVLRLR